MISLKSTVLPAYHNGWWTSLADKPCRYRVFFGGRNTGKSTNIGGIEPIMKILTDRRRNVLMTRKNDVDNLRSTFANIVWCIDLLGLNSFFRISKSPMTITRIATGQEIAFRGFNNPTGLTSLKARVGYFTDFYVEEASELDDYEAFRKLDGTLRAPDGIDPQITFMLNAWDVDCMIHKVFVDGRMPDNDAELETHAYRELYDPNFNIGFGWGLYLHQSTFRANIYRASYYDESMDTLRSRSYEIYRVEGLGCWGNSTDGVYPEFTDGNVIDSATARGLGYITYAIGIDFGVGGNPRKSSDGLGSATTMQLVGLTSDCSRLICIDEWFWSNEGRRDRKTGPEMQTEMIATIRKWLEKYSNNMTLMKGRIPVYVDSADSGGFRDGLALEARRQGLYQAVFQPSTKIRVASRIWYARRLMSYGDFLVSKDCPNLIREIKSSRKGDNGEPRADINDHAINACEYAWASFRRTMSQWKDFKEPI